jgi:hypothetical protein
MRNAKVEPLLAPLFLILAASGMTPQEHTGSGIPKMLDLKTDLILSAVLSNDLVSVNKNQEI